MKLFFASPFGQFCAWIFVFYFSVLLGFFFTWSIQNVKKAIMVGGALSLYFPISYLRYKFVSLFQLPMTLIIYTGIEVFVFFFGFTIGSIIYEFIRGRKRKLNLTKII